MTYEFTDDNKVVFDFELHSELPAGTPIGLSMLSDMLYFWPYSAPEYKLLEEAYLALARESHIL